MALIDNYKLGIMWSVGTLSKGRDRYSLQTSDKFKVYYLKVLSEIVGAEVIEDERMIRGELQPLWIIRFTDGVYADKLRELGYDDPEIEYPDFIEDDFICAVLECKLKCVSIGENINNVVFRAHCKKPEQWKRLTSKFVPDKQPNLATGKTYRFSYSKSDMFNLAKTMHKLDCSNKLLWSSIISICSQFK